MMKRRRLDWTIRTESDEHMELSEMRDQLADFESRTEKLGRRL